MELLAIFSLFVVTFVFMVLGVHLFKGCSLKNAVIICRDSTKDFISALFEPTPQYFPTVVGWDGIRILLKLVDSEFSIVRQNFSSCFCTWAGISNDTNLVCYRFEIQRKPNSLDDEILLEILQKQTEEVLSHTLREYECYMPTEPLTLAEIYPHVFYVAFARTEEGIRILDERKRKLKRRNLITNHVSNNSMTEEWGQSNE